MMKPSIEYLAGFMDGEGCISLIQNGRKRTSLSVRVTLTNTNVIVLTELHKEFGGTLSNGFRQKQRPLWKTRFHLIWYCEKAATLLRRLQPFLIVKRPQVELALAYHDLTKKRRLHKPLSVSDLEQNLEFHQKMSELNVVGTKGLPKGVDLRRRIVNEINSRVN